VNTPDSRGTRDHRQAGTARDCHFRACGLIIAFAWLLLAAGCGPHSGQHGPSALADSETGPSHPLQQFQERNDDPLAAAADRWQRRLSADGTVPRRALLNAKSQRDRLLVAGSRQDRSASEHVAWPVTWEWLGPGNIGGRLRPIVMHPGNPSIMYVGSASGGIWKTVNAGQHWFPLDDFLPSLSVSDLVMHPDDPDILFAATGEGFFEAPEGSSNTAAVRGAGIFRSIDAGKTWQQLTSTDRADFYFVNRLQFDPSDSSVLLAATGTGIWRSTDEGLTWNRQLAINALDLKFSPHDAAKVVAGGHHEHDGPWYSGDGGLNWQQASGAGGHRQEMAWAAGDAGTVYAAVSGSNGRILVWKSTDDGQTYTRMTAGNGIQTWASYNSTIWVDPANSDFLIVGGVWLYNSSDGGISLNQRFGAVHADMHRIVPHPDFDGLVNKNVYFATDGGIYRTDDVYGSSAVALNNNLGVTQFYGCGINPETGHVMGGTQDNGTLFYSGNPQAWDHVFGGDGGYGAADPLDPDYFYGEVQRALIHRSTTGGNGSNSYIYAGPNPIADAGNSNTTNFIPFFTLDPNNPDRMLVCCERLWRSNNVKAPQPDWFPVKDAIPPPPCLLPGPPAAHFSPNKPGNLSTVAIAPGDPDVIWAGHNNGHLYWSTNGTDASPLWTRADENGTGLPDRWISSIRIDPHDHQHVYVAFMGWEGDNLWETRDNGSSWIDVSGSGSFSVPHAPISALAIHPQLDGWLWVGTDIGIFSSRDNGVSWTTTPEGPAAAPVEQLLWKNAHQLLAVTHGRGLYLASERTVVPESGKLLDGVVDAGSLADVFASDDRYYRLSAAATSNPRKQIVDLVLQSTSPTRSPQTLQFRLQARMQGGPAGDVRQSVELYNLATGRFEPLDIQPASNTDDTVLLAVRGDRDRFVDPATREITARVRWDSPAFAGSVFTWSIDVDEAVWLIE
jgi:hypothetical protein